MRLALVTGVGRPGQVGEAVATRLAADGFQLILVDRDASGVEDRAAAIRATGGVATAMSADLSNPEAVERLASGIRSAHGPGLDAVVHLAGSFAVTGTVAETRVDDWERQLSINLRTAFLVARSAIPMLRERRGSMVFFSSESVLPGAKLARISAYGVAKTGVAALATAISQEERETGVRVNTLAPAAIRTAANIDSMPAGSRFVEREDVAATVAWLCSDASAAVTGQILRLSPR